MCDRGIGRLSPLIKQHIYRLGGTLVYHDDEEEYTQDWEALPPQLFTPIDYPVLARLPGHRPEIASSSDKEGEQEDEQDNQDGREPMRKKVKTDAEVRYFYSICANQINYLSSLP